MIISEIIALRRAFLKAHAPFPTKLYLSKQKQDELFAWMEEVENPPSFAPSFIRGATKGFQLNRTRLFGMDIVVSLVSKEEDIHIE